MSTGRTRGHLEGLEVFLSASIPDPSRWEGDFDPLEITDAVVAVGRTVLTAGGILVTAAHPTIAPLLLYVAAELPPSSEPRVIVYQSSVFDEILPEATRRFEADGIGTVVRTPAAVGEKADPATANRSLEIMRRQMLEERAPNAAVFIGGMAGIPVELALFNEICFGRPTYALGFPGGEAQRLAERSETTTLNDLLRNGAVYPTIARAIIDDIGGYS